MNNPDTAWKPNIDALLRQIAAEGWRVRDYSGRGMFGKSCLGFVADARPSQIYQWLHEAFPKAVASRLMATVAHDNMGHSFVYYWPGIPAAGATHVE